ncbi:hypothetical protein SASPL_120848 [Salvia splendens]|uniref:Protein SPT2 n=1 Tax=Salvia splendens TaxID=180675 RepID=A0A8X8XTU3_SALSN|nr:hypothetical protein SASPL_120848 [Salvia splendens]
MFTFLSSQFIRAMRGYEKDEYENWDEYEEDGEEQEEEEGGDDDYEEVHQSTQEELDYLAIRQKLKESIRKKMKKDAGTANSASRNKVNASRKDNYGSFFGPSQPVIAQRVIQESKSLLENPDLAARMCKTSQKSVECSAIGCLIAIRDNAWCRKRHCNRNNVDGSGRNRGVSATESFQVGDGKVARWKHCWAISFTVLSHSDYALIAYMQRVNVRNRLECRKRRCLRRVMSCLSILVHHANAYPNFGIATIEKKTYVSAPVSSKSQAPPNVKNGLKKKVEMLKNTRDYSFLLSDDAEVPASSKGPPPRNVSAPKSGNSYRFFRGLEDARSAEFMHRSGRSVVNGRVRDVSNGRDGRKPTLPCSQSKAKVGMDNVAHTNKSSAESRKQFGNNSGSGPGRPLGHKVVPSKSSVPATAKSAPPVAKNINSGVRKPTSSSLLPVARRPISSNLQSGNNRPTSSHGQPSTLRRPVQKDYHGTTKPKVISKQSLPSSKVQTKISPQRHPARVPLRDERPKAKPKRQLRDEDSEGADAINLIRQMFGYNPNRFRDDDDTDDMEANFDDIIREEKRRSVRCTEYLIIKYKLVQ